MASSQAAQGVAYMKIFDSHLVTLYYHFANSSVRNAALHEIQEAMEEPVLHLKKAIHTRWLSKQVRSKIANILEMHSCHWMTFVTWPAEKGKLSPTVSFTMQQAFAVPNSTSLGRRVVSFPWLTHLVSRQSFSPTVQQTYSGLS